MNIEDDLWSRWGPLQVSAHPNPQLVDVGMFSIVRRDGQRVRDGQELGEAGKTVRCLGYHKGNAPGLLARNLQLQPSGKLSGTKLLLQLNGGWRRDVPRDSGTPL